MKTHILNKGTNPISGGTTTKVLELNDVAAYSSEVLSGIAISQQTFGGSRVYWAVAGEFGHQPGDVMSVGGKKRYISAYQESDGQFILGIDLSTAVGGDNDGGDWQSLSLGK